MLAIPVFRARVAPVLNWCTTILVFPDEMADSPSGREIVLRDPSPFDLLRILHKEGVGTLICGALSSEILSFGEHLGMRIIHGVAGDIDEVLCAYREERLDQPSFRLPGCHGRRRYREGRLCEESQSDDFLDEPGRALPEAQGDSKSQNGKKTGQDRQELSKLSGHPGNQKVGSRRGPGGFCLCPHCGMKVHHEQGIPCTQIRCSRCNGVMERE